MLNWIAITYRIIEFHDIDRNGINILEKELKYEERAKWRKLPLVVIDRIVSPKI